MDGFYEDVNSQGFQRLSVEVADYFQNKGWNTVNNAATTGAPETDIENLGRVDLEGKNGKVTVRELKSSGKVEIEYSPEEDVALPGLVDRMLSKEKENRFIYFSNLVPEDSSEIEPDVSKWGYTWEVSSEEGSAVVAELVRALDQPYSEPEELGKF